jgi:surface carbohydrate biosynthesis protein
MATSNEHRKIKALMVIDIPSRDLRACCHVAYQLITNHNCKVIFTSTKNEIAMMLRYMPEVIILSHVQYERFTQVVSTAKELGISVCIMPTEGIYVNENSVIPLYGREELLESVDLFLAWGPLVAEKLKQHFPSKDISITGSPRFDTHNERYHDFFGKRDDFFDQYNLRINLPLITWVSFGGYIEGEIESLLDSIFSLSKLGNIVWNQNRVTDQRLTYKMIRDFFTKLSIELPKNNFAYKPHPLEDASVYQPLLDEFPQIKLIPGKSPIEETLIFSDVIVGFPCTAALDSFVQNLNTKAIYCRHDQLKEPLECQVEILECGKTVRDYPDFKSNTQAALTTTFVTEEAIEKRKALIYKQLYLTDGNASERTADAIYQTAAQSEAPHTSLKFSSKLLRMAYSKIRRGHCLDLKRPPEHPKYFDPEKIHDLIEQFEKILGQEHEKSDYSIFV